MLTYTLDLQSAAKPLDKYWEFCVGSCHAATALREDYRNMLRQCRHDLGFRYIRFHGLFNDDMSTVLKPMFSDKYIYSFTNIDNIFDFLLSIDMKPFVELGFMPTAFASSNTTIFHYKGNTSPPKDYALWCDFISAFIRHLIERYGLSEVRQWYFEVWNEPNLGGNGSPYGFWSGDRAEYFKLYRHTVQAVKKCDCRLRVGGPATSNNAWIPEFTAFCEKENLPLDFISTHQYPTDVVLGYGVEDSANLVNPLNISDQAQVEHVMQLAKDGGEAFEEFKAQYSVFQSELWAHVDRGVLTEMTKKAVQEAKGLPVYYTEWGSLAGLESDSAFGASFIAKTVLDGVNLCKGYSFWTFCDIIEESGQNSDEFFGGFGLMTQHGIPKAPYRAYQLLHMLNGELYQSVYRSETVDVYAVRNTEIGALQLLAVNHHSLLHEIHEETVEIRLQGASDCLCAEEQRVDETHANAYRAWECAGKKAYLTRGEIDSLKGQSELCRKPLTVEMQDGEAVLRLELPPMSTVLATVYWV